MSHDHDHPFRLLVGAPQAETPDRQPHVENGGALYGCLLHERRCRQIQVDRRGTTIDIIRL